jgi:hypothetical protein
MSVAKSHPIQHKSDHPHLTEDGTGLSHVISSVAQEAVTKGLQNGNNMGNHKMSKFRTL